MTPLTRGRILAAAVAMADHEGLEAVTMRRIAAALGVHVTSLYNHVNTREAVSDGIVEVLFEEADLPLEPLGWEAWVRRFHTAMGGLALRHPGAFAILMRRPVQGPRAAASFEVALAAFREAGLEAQDAYGAVKIAVHTALTAGLERSQEAQGPSPETDIEALPATDFPQFHTLRGIEDPSMSWDFGLETVVAGLRAQIAERATR
ncbi:TetR/AcrR family transcriptional regulator [Kineococcus radiotolerans]|uniref:TetR/AcrR family transcriptional regulator n=1 Tax=Kineococcus radiotolerans TaxID=131568 RepID=UPI0012FEBB72|nr:TetR/AcrR family transcriptional regulator C-terminal domain-containing protein [Kineococcus radiotolerans]